MMNIFSSFDQVNYFCLVLPLFLFFYFYSFNVKSNIMFFSYYSDLELSKFFNSLSLNGFSKISSFSFVSLFFFIFISNFLSLHFYSFSITTQTSLVLFIAFIFWSSCIFFTLFLKPKKLIYHFIPIGSPISLAVFLFLIEVVSSLIRPLTLSIRLVANIFTGHLIVSLLSNLVYIFNVSFFLLLILCLVESIVAMLQSYIFVTLCVLYYSEV